MAKKNGHKTPVILSAARTPIGKFQGAMGQVHPSELGATGSDDVCLVQRASPDPSDDETTLVLQHGAFVPASPSELTNRSSQWRAIVKGESHGDHWSMLVEME